MAGGDCFQAMINTNHNFNVGENMKSYKTFARVENINLYHMEIIVFKRAKKVFFQHYFYPYLVIISKVGVSCNKFDLFLNFGGKHKYKLNEFTFLGTL